MFTLFVYIFLQPAPFEDTKENQLPPPTPGAGLIASGRLPGGRDQSEDEDEDIGGGGEPLSPPVSPTIDEEDDDKSDPESFDQVPKTPAPISIPSEVTPEAKRPSVVEKEAVNMDPLDDSMELIGKKKIYKKIFVKLLIFTREKNLNKIFPSTQFHKVFSLGTIINILFFFHY